MSREPTEDSFAKHVADHQMTVGIDDGLYRHLTFKQPRTSNRYFNITTWPGYLTISGDMGCYVFARLPDMFEFFRDDKGRINLSYWAEKLQATQRGSGHMEFSDALYRWNIVSDFKAAYPPGVTDRMLIWQDVRRELLEWFQPVSTSEAVSKAMEYTDPNGAGRFYDFYEHRLEDYTYHFVWCCRAIVWAIQRYDEYKADQRFPGLASIHASLLQSGVAA